jgi:hypothetical protein
MRVDRTHFLIPNSSFLIPHCISVLFNGVAYVRDLNKRNFKKRKRRVAPSVACAPGWFGNTFAIQDKPWYRNGSGPA